MQVHHEISPHFSLAHPAATSSDSGAQGVGYGATEVSAALDLVVGMIEAEPEHPSHGMGGGLMREAQIKTCERLAVAVRELAL